MSSIAETNLGGNAFFILNVTARDSKQKIISEAELAELSGDSELVQKAKAALTNPRMRIASEIGWLVGVSPKRARDLCEELARSPIAIFDESGIPKLAHANLQSAAFQLLSELTEADSISSLIQKLAFTIDALNLEEILRDINEERIVAGFPELATTDAISAAVQEQKKSYKVSVKDFLNRLDTKVLIQSMTHLVDTSTLGGSVHAEEFVDELVDSYEVETRGFLEREFEAITKFVSGIKASAQNNAKTIEESVRRLCAMVEKWDSVAQPIQLSFKARGITHDLSKNLGYEIRGLAIDLHNEYGMTESAKSVSSLIQDFFSDVPELEERIEQDLSKLDELLDEKKQQEKEDAEFEREITFSAEIGVVFKELLAISPKGVSYGSAKYALDEITRIRWGSIRQSVNGIPTGTTYEIAFGNQSSETIVRPRMEHVYTKFTDALWRAVGVRIMFKLFSNLSQGGSFKCGNFEVFDDGVKLTKKGFFSGGEAKKFDWSDVSVWSANGSFFVRSKSEEKFTGSAAYMSDANVHVIELAIRAFFKNSVARKLSEAFKK